MPPKDPKVRRQASADFHAKRKAEGWRKVTVWLSPEAVFKLDALKAKAGSADDAVRKAIMAWNGPAADPEQSIPDLLRTQPNRPAPAAEKFTGTTASGEPLPKRQAYQKGGKK